MPHRTKEQATKARNRYYEKNKDRYYALNKQRRDRLHKIVQDAKNVPCMDCGVKYPYYVMDFDHRGDKSFTIAKKWFQVGEETLRTEIAKCDVTCSNCHRVRTHNRVCSSTDRTAGS